MRHQSTLPKSHSQKLYLCSIVSNPKMDEPIPKLRCFRLTDGLNLFSLCDEVYDAYIASTSHIKPFLYGCVGSSYGD